MMRAFPRMLRCCSVLQCRVVCCSVLQFVAVCCSCSVVDDEGISVDTEVAVCCSVLQLQRCER